jgi:predicted nicotinamide N-methyase
VVELGCGISGLVALLVAPRVARYVLTDQPYVARLLEQNISQNSSTPVKKASSGGGGRHSKSSPRAGTPAAGSSRRGSPASSSSGGRRETATGAMPGRDGIHFTPLDWETDQVTPALTGGAEAKKSFDVIVACDCIYNEALVEPFVATCVDLCRLRAADHPGDEEAVVEPCVCVVAQQLRDPLVFEAWVARFARSFHTWRVPDEMLGAGLRAGSGFVVHVGVLRDGGGGGYGGGISLEAI